MLATFPAQDAPRRPQDARRCPTRMGYDAIWCPHGIALGIDHFWDASWDRFFGRFGSILTPFWKIFGRFLEDFLEEFAVQPASSNLFSKKACLHKFAFQKSQPKPKGPAVFAAGVGNPPAPSLPGVQERVQDSRTEFGLF